MNISELAFVHPRSVQHGDVTVGDYSSLWASSVMRGDFGSITIGRFTNIQDNVTLHASPGAPLKIGDCVTVAHNAMLHGCTVEDNCMISMGSVVQDHCVIGAGTIVGAGAVVREGTKVPPGSLVLGVPAVVKEGKPGQFERGKGNALSYAAMARLYAEDLDVTDPNLLVKKMEELKPILER